MDALQIETKVVEHKPAVKQVTGSEVLLRCLVEEGVTTLFGHPGGAIMPVYDALYHYSDQFEHILVRHEQGAVHAAQGYARVSGKVGVAITTSGPGATNLVTGLADALIDSTQIVCITGQVSAHLLGTDAFQETDVINMTTPVTKWNIQVTQAKDITSAVARAFYIAKTGRPGPVLIDITKNAQSELIEESSYQKCDTIRTYESKPVLNMRQVEDAAALINRASKPYMLAGQGILLSGASKELVAFSEKTGIPVACTLLGLGSFPTDHPNYAGFLGMHGNYAPNVNTNECDLLIGIGMRFDDRVTGNVNRYARQAKKIHIDIDKAEINKIIKADVAVHADAREALRALLTKCDRREHKEWIKSFQHLHGIEYEKVVSKELNPSGQITMAEVINKLSAITGGKAVLVTDVGQHQMVASRYYEFKDPDTQVTSGGAGTMGFALPAAIGAKLSQPGKQVVAVIGDGGFQMTLQELGTIMEYQIPVKIIILNNNFLGMVRQWQQLFHEKRYSFSELTNPDFVNIAEAYNIPAQRVTEREDLSGALKKLIESKTPSFLEIVVGKEHNVFPMIPVGAGVAEVLLEAPSL